MAGKLRAGKAPPEPNPTPPNNVSVLTKSGRRRMAHPITLLAMRGTQQPLVGRPLPRAARATCFQQIYELISKSRADLYPLILHQRVIAISHRS